MSFSSINSRTSSLAVNNILFNPVITFDTSNATITSNTEPGSNILNVTNHSNNNLNGIYYFSASHFTSGSISLFPAWTIFHSYYGYPGSRGRFWSTRTINTTNFYNVLDTSNITISNYGSKSLTNIFNYADTDISSTITKTITNLTLSGEWFQIQLPKKLSLKAYSIFPNLNGFSSFGSGSTTGAQMLNKWYILGIDSSSGSPNYSTTGWTIIDNKTDKNYYSFFDISNNFPYTSFSSKQTGSFFISTNYSFNTYRFVIRSILNTGSPVNQAASCGPVQLYY
jgi:hypothetical protein